MSQGADGGAEKALRSLVDALEDEVTGLRDSARLRAVIEQAKGVLVERYKISPSEAFDRLRSISQKQNARLVDVAATVLGLAAPSDDGEAAAAEDADLPRQMQESSAVSEPWRSLRGREQVRVAAVGVAVESLAAATADGDAAADLLVELAGASEPDGVLIYAVTAGDCLDLLGGARYPGEVTDAWTHIPLTLDIPLVRCAQRGTPEIVVGAAAMLESYPSLTPEALYGYQAWLLAPVIDRKQVVGVVAMGWRSRHVVEEAERKRLLALVRRTGPVFLRTLSGREPVKRQLTGLLRLSRDPWLVLVPGEPSRRSLETMLIEAVAPEVPDSESWAGRRLLAAVPGLAEQHSLMLDLTRLLQDDALFVLAIDVPGTSGAPWDSHPGQLRAVRAGRRLVLTWREGGG